MVLSHDMIEAYAICFLDSFSRRCHLEETDPNKRKYARATPIEQFATQYLGLELIYTKLSNVGNVLGITAYADTAYQFAEGGSLKTVPLLKNQVLLDTRLAPNKLRDTNRCRRRFTIAHECAHQILFRMESCENKDICCRMYTMGQPFSMRDLKTREDWNEWQANALASALLMPNSEIVRVLGSYPKPLVCFGGMFRAMDRYTLDTLCRSLVVSHQAMVIRLRELGYLIDRLAHEFYDPLEVMA